MTEDGGSQELVRIASAYLASIAFGVTFLVATLTGADGFTALTRGVGAMIAACIAGRLLFGPAVRVVIAAMARDEAVRKTALEASEESTEEAK